MTQTTQLSVTTGLGGRTSWITTPTLYRDGGGLPYRSVLPVAAPLVAVTTATATAAENTTTSKKSSAQPMAMTTTTTTVILLLLLLLLLR